MARARAGHRRKPPRPTHAPGRRTPRRRCRGIAAERGQSSVEFVALLPILVLVAIAMGQAAVAGYAAWSAAGAARVGARAAALGGDPAPAVRGALPALLLHGRRVQVRGSAGTPGAGTVRVRLRVPSIVPGLRFGTVAGRAQLPPQVAP